MLHSMLFFIVLVAVFTVLNILDGHSTYLVVSKTNANNEKNPIARIIFRILGPLVGIIVLKSILIPIVFLMFYYFRLNPGQMNLILILANIFYLLVVIHNYNVVKRIKANLLLMNELGIDDN